MSEYCKYIEGKECQYIDVECDMCLKAEMIEKLDDISRELYNLTTELKNKRV